MEMLEDLIAGHTGAKSTIEQDDVVGSGARQGETAFAIRCDVDAKPLELELPSERFSDRKLILDEKHAQRRGAGSLFRRTQIAAGCPQVLGGCSFRFRLTRKVSRRPD